MNNEELSRLYDAFIQSYTEEKKNVLWKELSIQFRTFWNERIMKNGS